MNIKDLVGRTVIGAQINKQHDVVILTTNLGKLFLTWTGDCCAKCYIAHLSGAKNLIGQTILEAKDTEWKTIQNEDYEVVETMGTSLKSNKGYITFETRLEHNGFYAGYINISDKGPIGQYDSILESEDVGDLVDLKDF